MKLTNLVKLIVLIFFIFGANTVYGATIYEQPDGGTFHSTGGAMYFCPTANGTINHLRFYPTSSYQDNYFAAVIQGPGMMGNTFDGALYKSLVSWETGDYVDLYNDNATSTVSDYTMCSTSSNFISVDVRYDNLPIDTIDDFGNFGNQALTMEDNNNQVTYSGEGARYEQHLFVDGESAPPNIGDTRIISFSPEEGDVVTGPTVDFDVLAYINADDVGSYSGIKITLENIDQNVLLLGFLSPSSVVLLNDDITTAGSYTFSTSTTLGDGNYRIEACLRRSYLGGWIVNPFSNVVDNEFDCKSHQFIVGEPTFIGNISQRAFSETNEFFTGLSATSSAVLASSCNPINANFDVRTCSAYLFIPDSYSMRLVMEDARNGILTRVPWGYLTRTYTILTASTTASLPTFTSSIQMDSGWTDTPDIETLTFDMNDMIAGGGTLVDSLESTDGHTFRDIFQPIIQIIIGMMVIFTIYSDISSSHNHQQEKTSKQNT